jgi:hypothetical protein
MLLQRVVEELLELAVNWCRKEEENQNLLTELDILSVNRKSH